MIGNYFFSNSGAAAYEIEQSLRFNSADSTRLYKTTSGFGITTTCTISWWHKKAAGSTSNTHWMCGSYPNMWSFESTDTASNGFRWTNNGGTVNGPSGSKYRDYSGWYHWIVTQNGTVSKVYLNGKLIRQDNSNSGSSATNWYIGAENTNNYLNGYLAEFHFLDGTAVTDATSFGEFDDNGVWRPIEYTGGNYGTDGFYLKFDSSATNGIGHDHSGNGNNFTASGFTTSGTGTDVMSDTPTTNYCTLNPIGTTYGFQAPTDGNLKTDANSYLKSTEGTFGIPKDGNLYYFEGTMTRAVGDGGTGLYFGTHTQGTTSAPNGSSGKYFGVYGTDGGAYDGAQIFWQYGNQLGGLKYGHINAGTVLAYAIKYDSGTWKYWYRQGSNGWHYYNGSSWVYNTSFDATEPTGSSSSVPESETLVPIGNNIIFNFGQRAFTYTAPTGAKYLRSSDLPAPDIADGSDYFQTVLWTGDNTDDRSITVADNSGNSWQPDWVWYKRRNISASHLLFDSVRGATKCLRSDNDNDENTESNALQAFESTGFQVGSDANSNSSSYTFVGWNWKEGATPGFDIVGYSGSGGNATVSHALGVAPQLIIVKRRNNNNTWLVWHHKLSSIGKYLILSSGEGVQDGGGTSFGGSSYTMPTSSVFTVGSSNSLNNSNGTYVAYCFAEVEGYSKFGSYTGNGNDDGPFVYCGFKPALIIIKRTEGNTSWHMLDTTRDTYNVADSTIRADASTQEQTDNAYRVDLLSNGFKLRDDYVDTNSSGKTFVFMAWAQNPFGGSGVSPATAR